jgi:hypothetical protein
VCVLFVSTVQWLGVGGVERFNVNRWPWIAARCLSVDCLITQRAGHTLAQYHDYKRGNLKSRRNQSRLK